MPLLSKSAASGGNKDEVQFFLLKEETLRLWMYCPYPELRRR